jgi:hypothetical protein
MGHGLHYVGVDAKLSRILSRLNGLDYYLDLEPQGRLPEVQLCSRRLIGSKFPHNVS